MKKKIIIIALIIVVLVVIGILFLPKTSSKTDELAGLWDVDGNTKYEFNGKGTGKIIVPNSEYEFTYVIEDNVVSIDFKSEKSTDTKYEFKVQKDSMELKDLTQPNVNLKLKKVNK